MESYPNLRQVGSPESYQVKYHLPSSKFVFGNFYAFATLKIKLAYMGWQPSIVYLFGRLHSNQALK